MSDNPLHPSQNPKRDKSLQQLSQIYSKIQFLELPENQFSTEELHQLSLLAQYSIHPVFSSKAMHQFHLKLTEKYWSKFDQLKNANHCEIPEERPCIIQKDENSHVNSNQTPEIDPKVTPIQKKEEIITDLNIPHIEKQTEAILPQPKQVRLQLKVAKTYNDIKKFSLQFDYEKVLENQSISPKIKLLNSWTPVPCKLLNLAPKKVVQTPCKIDSASYLESIKMGKNARKDSNNIEPSKTIILGKNQSTEMKQMKHMLKVQAKTNFVEQKQKEESKLDDIQKKSIQLNYLLNVITKEFFEDFFGDILKIVRGNGKIIEILCEKLIEKVKGQHNFIEIYVELIKRLTKSSLTEGQQKNTRKFNQLQQFFVAYLQQSFVKLISLQIEPSCSNFNEYKYQKEMMGMCKFIGKLIKQKILSKKIFKVCFWQIVYRYVEKVKQNPENDIVNECLIEAIVVIQDSMGSVELLKLMEKEKQAQQKESDEPMEITNFQEMMMALVDPSDQDHISRQQSYKKLIESIKVEEYPHILMGLLHIFSSKRMKLQFLIEHWQQKIELMKTTSPQNVDKMEEERTAKIENSEKMIEDVVEAQEEDLFEIKKVIHEFVKEIKVQTDLLSSTNNKEPKTKKPHNPQLHRHQSIIKKFIGQSPSKNSVANGKIFKLLVIQFLTHFADCKHPQTIPLRIGYFIDFVQPLHLTQHFHSRLLQIICKEEIENLMIIECDYPFLVDGLCLILVEVMGRVKVGREEVEKRMGQSYQEGDDDMDEFCGKVVGHLEKVWEKENGVKHGDQEIFQD